MHKRTIHGDDTPPTLITARIAELGDWRGETLKRIRALIRAAAEHNAATAKAKAKPKRAK